MYKRLLIQNVYNNGNNEKSFRLKYTNKHQQRLIYDKIDKINKLDRAILNNQMEINHCSLCKTCSVEEQNKSVKKLSLMKNLKSKWEKELLYMYFEEI